MVLCMKNISNKQVSLFQENRLKNEAYCTLSNSETSVDTKH